jgi:hypothetical protein
LPLIVTGSTNWTANAVQANDENLLIAHDADHARTRPPRRRQGCKITVPASIDRRQGGSSGASPTITVRRPDVV